MENRIWNSFTSVYMGKTSYVVNSIRLAKPQEQRKPDVLTSDLVSSLNKEKWAWIHNFREDYRYCSPSDLYFRFPVTNDESFLPSFTRSHDEKPKPEPKPKPRPKVAPIPAVRSSKAPIEPKKEWESIIFYHKILIKIFLIAPCYI